MMPNKRIEYFDTAKGLLIICLLFHHFTSASTRVGISNEKLVFFLGFQILFVPFFMQAFFFISGYCSNHKKKFKDMALGGVNTLLVPALFFDFLRKITDSLLYNNIDVIYKFYTTSEFLKSSTLWFLYALFIAKILYWLIVNGIKNKTIRLLTCLMVTILGVFLHQLEIGVNVFYIYHALGSIFFIALGHYMRDNDCVYQQMLKLGLVLYPVVLVLFSVYQIGIPAFTASMNISLSTFPIFLFLSSFGIFWLLSVLKLWSLGSCFSFVGRNTIIIYGVHFIFLQFVIYMLSDQLQRANHIQAIVLLGIIYIVEFVLCYLSVLIFNTKYLSWAIGRS